MGLIHNPALRTVLLGGLTAETIAWRNSVVSDGQPVATDTVKIVDRLLVRPLKSTGLWDKCYMIDPCVGGNMAASLHRLKSPSGVARKAVTGGFADGDYNERGSSGGRTGNGSSKSIDTLINPSSLGFSTSSFMLWAYTRAAIVGTGSSRASFGNQGAAGVNSVLAGWVSSGTIESIAVGSNAGTESAPGTATSRTGLLGGGTNGSRVTQFYANGSAVGGTSTGTQGFFNGNIFAHAVNANGTPAAFCTRPLSSMWLTQGLSASEVATFYSIVQAFETALNRNV